MIDPASRLQITILWAIYHLDLLHMRINKRMWRAYRALDA